MTYFSNPFIIPAKNWPPDYSIRRSTRARRAALKISPRTGLEVVLPMRFKLADVENLLNEKRRWIEKHLALIEQAAAQPVVPEPPAEIHLKSCAEIWKIFYSTSLEKTQIIVRPQYELTVTGNLNDKKHCGIILTRWIREKARQILMPRLQTLSRELNLPYKSLTIRGQKTRWGSCSSRGAISLNYKLIFLPPEIVRHILIHELCHTVYLNHSHRFWRLVAKCDADWKKNHELSRKMDDQVPAWLD